MTQNYLNKLEYNKILEILENFCTTYLGKNLSLNLVPSNDKYKVQNLLDETSQAIDFIVRKGNLPIAEIPDISIWIKKLESCSSLSSKGLLDVALILKLSRELKQYFYNDTDFDLSCFNILDNYFSCLYSNVGIEDKIFSSIIDENNISDNASSKLFSLRKNRKKLESEIKENLNKIIHSSSYSKCIMDPIVTIRNDRYVIPVKEEFKGIIKGFIHDISSSGSTIFVEPLSVFELNNSINNIKIEENIEIEKILEDLSNSLSAYTNELNTNIDTIGKIDFIFAKAKYAKQLNAISPNINENKFINLVKVKHPLIDTSVVVPIDISIGESYTSLIITGPNTGGKTVTLKTVGLITLMACSGLHIPADSSSSIYVFDNIFADIGDEQSIQESLSTFSAHILNIKKIIDNITPNSLILLDELGSGTDPLEGENLAISILEYLNNFGVLTIATTHYQAIKNYALTHDSFENASSEFDIESLKPTYKLLIGIPGKSNAFAISKKLGISESILNRAKELLNSDDISIEELMKNIYDNKIEIENQKDKIFKDSNKIKLLKEALERENLDLKVSKEEYVDNAKIEAKSIIISAKEDVNDTINEINKIYEKFKLFEDTNIDCLNDSEIVSIVRNNLSNNYNLIKKANKLRNDLNNSLKNITNNNDENISSNTSNYKKEDLKVGMNILINNFNDVATICSLSGKPNVVQVIIGNAKMSIKINDIYKIINDSNNIKDTNINIKKSNINNTFKSKTVSTEINVIGQNVEDACFIIDKYLDDCYVSKLQSVRIVHGKGTGKLREGIHTFLKKHPHVKSFRIGTFGEGEMGVTVVELK